MTYLIKVLWTGEDIIYRDLKASEEHNLLDLHHAILKAFDLNADQMAGFTKIDEDLQIEVDYQLEAFDENSSLMEEVQLKEVIKEEGDILDYTYDFLNEIRFSIEVIEVLEDKVKEISIEKAHGKLSKDLLEAADPGDAQSILIQAMLGDENLEDPDGDLFDNEDFESLDDLDDLY